MQVAFPPSQPPADGRAPSLGALLVKVASAYFGVGDEKDVFRNGRMPCVCRVRWAVAMVLYSDIGWGKKRIAKFLIKDKKAVHHGLKRAQTLYQTDPQFFAGVELLRKEVFL